MTHRVSPIDDPLKGALKGIPFLSPGDRCVFSALFGSSSAYLIARAFVSNPRPVLVVVPTLEEAEEFFGDLEFFLGKGKAMLFPPTERLPFEESFTHPELMARRLEFLYSLTCKKNFIAITTASTLTERLIPKAALEGAAFRIRKGGEYPRDGLLENLIKAGYTRVSMVEERGEMSVRGAIIDIFGPMHATALRVEFFADEVESIREFDPSTQRSTKEIDELLVLPAREGIMGASGRGDARARLAERADVLKVERSLWEPLSNALRDGVVIPGLAPLVPYFHDALDTLFDYLPESALVTLVEPRGIAEELEAAQSVIEKAEARLIEQRRFFVEPESLFLSVDEVDLNIKRFPIVEIEEAPVPVSDVAKEIGATANIGIAGGLEKKLSEAPLKPLADKISGFIDRGRSVYVTAHNKGQAERTRELFEGYGLDAVIEDSSAIILNEPPGAPSFMILIGSLRTGFMMPEPGICVISEADIFGKRLKHRAPPERKLDSFLSELRDLREGDGIVHALHGIAIYRGLKRITVEGIENDFLILEYRGNDKLYLPVYRMDQITKYHGASRDGSTSFTPDKLGGPGWGKRTKRARKAVERIAAELLKLYAEREASSGYGFSPPDHIFREFEAGFEYEPTGDQSRSITEVIEDMERSRPMDRLLCGDVGYGKTEVAMRAAFKAVLDNKQVALLVPTTVLAQQHGMTFAERFAPYPVNVEVLSRFRSKKEQNEVVTRLALGEVDILIGTHRLLGADVAFKDLGLVIVDEEHRFGVKHKERLRDIKKEVDVLTLTATPIPRTLQMSIADIRGLSIIATPPEDRLAIKTVVTAFDEGLIKDAIEREVRRGGQVFFVHNRVESIGAIAELLERIVPDVRVAVAHGQMRERELEKKMLGFMDHSYDVLLCTTIIESGLDIASANTIIINRADRFGLAELYQLRGRVGRSNHRAYAYLLCPLARLKEDARKRLDAITMLTEPGSGFMVASHDLEIRGAGELLGASQSGHISEVGFDMYTTLLTEAVAELRGEPVSREPSPEVNLRVSAYIPEDYIPDTRQRLGIYKRLSELCGEDELYALTEELEDRYGEVPEFVQSLIRMASIRLLLVELGAREIKELGTRLYIRFSPVTEEGGGPGEDVVNKALALMKKEPKRYRITKDSRFVYSMGGPDPDPIEEARYILKEFLQ